MYEPYNSGLRVSATYGLGCRLWGSGLGSSKCLGAESGFGSVRVSGVCNTVSRIQNGSSWRVGFATHCLGPESRVQNGGSLRRNTSTIESSELTEGCGEASLLPAANLKESDPRFVGLCPFCI